MLNFMRKRIKYRMRNLFKYFGSKNYLKSFIIPILQPKLDSVDNFVDAFGGAGTIVLNTKPNEQRLDIYNDIDAECYEILYYTKNFLESFVDELRKVEYTEETFLKAVERCKAVGHKQGLEYAVAAYIRKRMSRGGMGSTFGWSTRLRNNLPGDLNSWLTSIDNLKTVNKRLQSITLLNYDALAYIKFHDVITHGKTLYYLDPTYVSETRKSKNVYNYEMTLEQHEEMCGLADRSQNYFAISGYENQYYNKWLSNFNVHKKEIVNHSGQNKKKQKRTECLFVNF